MSLLKTFYTLVFTMMLGLSYNTQAADICTSIGASYYYSVTHEDFRKCASPMCGGYFVKHLNKERTLCADGVWRNECHIFQLDTKALNWTAEQTNSYFNNVFGTKTGIVRGNFAHALDANSPFTANVPDTLTITEAWQAQSKQPSVGLLYHVKDTGIMCITTPCLDDTIEQVVNLWEAKDKMINGVSLETAGVSQDVINAGYQALSKEGILVAGKHRLTAAGKARILVASQFYLPVKAAAPVSSACNTKISCPTGQVPDAKGVCQIKPDICTMNYVPVCGCDGVTYGNNCGRMSAGAQLDYVGECKVVKP